MHRIAIVVCILTDVWGVAAAARIIAGRKRSRALQVQDAYNARGTTRVCLLTCARACVCVHYMSLGHRELFTSLSF